ncbi:MAG: alanine racemase [Chloroflexota bacterium]|nr:alanine racemase [Chloroflexota bacterium]
MTARSSVDDRLAAAGLPPLPRTAWLEIDLDRLRANLAAFRAAVPAGVRIEPVVKADGYGHGAVEVTRALEAAGADGFSVAAFDEAVELRDAGIRAPILCLYAIPPAVIPAAMRLGVAVAASGEDLLDRMVVAAGLAWQGGAGGRPRRALAIHLDVETGLGRAGLEPDRVAAAARRLRSSPGVRLAGIWCHIQQADDRPLTAGQDARFEVALGRLAEAVGRPPLRHQAASAGLLGRVVPAYDAVRIGLATYGIVPDDVPLDEATRSPAVDIRPILSLHARPVRVADLPTGTGISYGPTFTTARPSRIATLPLGYGDGFPRALSNRAQALVRGHRVPLVGNVAMDAVMADVTDIPGRPVTVDDEFVLIGSQGGQTIALEDLARLRTTNTWETVTALSRRLPRVYHAAAVPVAARLLAQWRGR